MKNYGLSPERLAERKQGLGGSDIAAVFGLSPWRTAVDLWLDKTGQTDDSGEDPTRNLALYIGSALEGLAADLYADRHGVQIFQPHVPLRDGIMQADIDRIVVPEGKQILDVVRGGALHAETGLECKTSSQRKWEEVPEYYQVQAQWYMGLAPEIQQFDFPVIFLGLGKEFEDYRIFRDNEAIAVLQQGAKEWWQKHIVEGVKPEPANEADCRKLWAVSNDRKVMATPEAAAAIEGLRAIAAQTKTLEAEETRLRTIVMESMQDADVLVGPDGKKLCTWKSAKDRSETDWKAVAAAVGVTDEAIAANTVVKPGSRVLRVSAA